jgi:hypothetical protein
MCVVMEISGAHYTHQIQTEWRLRGRLFFLFLAMLTLYSFSFAQNGLVHTLLVSKIRVTSDQRERQEKAQ